MHLATVSGATTQALTNALPAFGAAADRPYRAAHACQHRGSTPMPRITAAAGVTVLELTRHSENLEELFFDLTSDHADDRALEVSPS